MARGLSRGGVAETRVIQVADDALKPGQHPGRGHGLVGVVTWESIDTERSKVTADSSRNQRLDSRLQQDFLGDEKVQRYIGPETEGQANAVFPVWLGIYSYGD